MTQSRSSLETSRGDKNRCWPGFLHVESFSFSLLLLLHLLLLLLHLLLISERFATFFQATPTFAQRLQLQGYDVHHLLEPSEIIQNRLRTKLIHQITLIIIIIIIIVLALFLRPLLSVIQDIFRCVQNLWQFEKKQP